MANSATHMIQNCLELLEKDAVGEHRTNTHRLDDKTGGYNVVAVKVFRLHATFL